MLRHCLKQIPRLLERASARGVLSSNSPSMLRCCHGHLDQRFSLLEGYPLSRFNREIMTSFELGSQTQKPETFKIDESFRDETLYRTDSKDAGVLGELRIDLNDCMKFTVEVLLSQESVNADDIAMVTSAFHNLCSLIYPNGRLALIWPSLLLMLLSEYHSHERCLPLGQVVFEYVHHERAAPLLVPYLGFIRLLSKCKGETALLKKSYEDLMREYPVLDVRACDRLISVLASTELYSECFNLKEKVEEFNIRLSPKIYGNLIIELFRHKENAKALSLLREMAYHNVAPLSPFYLEIFSGEFDRDVCYALIDVMRELHWILPTAAAAEGVADWLQSDGWDTTSSSIKRLCCDVCDAETQRDILTDEEFEIIKKSLTDDVMIGNDIYEKTNPKEMDAYLDFVHKNGKFDVVIDGLNVVSWDWKRSVKERQGCERLEMALKDLFSKSRNPESLRLAVIGRQHVRRRWASVEKRFPQVAFFYSADVSHDDIFLLYAAANSGPSTYFLTRDKLRNYRSQMGSVAGLMARWQRNRQLFYTTADRRIHVMYPSSHRLQVFGDDKSLHIPYVNDHRSTVTGAVPDEWICALKR